MLSVGSGSSRAANTCASLTPARSRNALRSGLLITAMHRDRIAVERRGESIATGFRYGRSIVAAACDSAATSGPASTAGDDDSGNGA